MNVAHHLARIESALINNDAPLVIGSCEELLETVFKIVVKDAGVEYLKSEELPALYRMASEQLATTTLDDPKTRASIKTIMRTLLAVVRSVAELRNTMGTGHGSDADPVAEARHARLPFNSTVTVVEYIADSWRAHNS